MAIDAQMEHYISLSIEDVLRRSKDLSGKTIQTYGTVSPPQSTVEEWLALHIIQIRRRHSRRESWEGRVLFQVSCFSRVARGRDDGQKNAAMVLAAKVCRLLEQSVVQIQRLGEDDETTVAWMRTSPGDIVVLPPKPEERTQSVVVTFDGFIVTGIF